MFRTVLSFGGMLLLAGAVVLVTPGLGQAQHGGHAGGGHAGGGHVSGGHIGGAHFGGAPIGGYHGGVYHGGVYHHDYSGGYHYGYPQTYAYPGYGYRHFDHHYYGYYPYYGYYNYPYSYDTAPYAGSSPTYDSGYYGSNGDVTPSGSDQSAQPAVTAQPDTNAHITVNVPADARLWFGQTATTATGPVRDFHSPPLTPGSRYTYDVRARWNENGHEVTRTQQVEVSAGAHVNVTFPVPPRAVGQASAVKK